MAAQQSFKERIRSGERLFGASIPMHADVDWLRGIVTRRPYDFVSVDAQHSAFSEHTLEAFCAAAGEVGVPVWFRIKHTRFTFLVGNYLDLGPTGVEIPQVETEETVDEAVANFYYPHTGLRSWGGQTRVGLAERPDMREYADWWEQTGVLWMQIESVEAITKARMLAKPGVDCLSFGPADLTFSLEAHPDHPFKTVDDCVSHVVQQMRDSEVAVCFRNYDPALRQKYRDMGVTVLLERP
jgi:2-dehydro-3-deoxyglucarate aldolase/4-hydroxy-2-oxoheptanedioate aldolase